MKGLSFRRYPLTPQPPQKSKLLAPALPDPKLCRWRSAFYFDPPINKEVYEGEMLNNMRDGQGVFLYRNGNTYEGGWKKNYEHGRGVLFNKKRQVIYDGEFDKGKLTGRGENGKRNIYNVYHITSRGKQR